MSKFTAAEVKNKVVVIGNGDSSCFYTTSGVIVGDQIAAENMKSLDGVMLKIADIVQISDSTQYDVVCEAEAAEKKAMGEVVAASETKNLDVLRQGFVIIAAEFNGSIANKRPMTSEEIDKVLANMNEEQRREAKKDLDGMVKRLFAKEGYKELDALMSGTQALRESFKMLGQPFANGQTIMKVSVLCKYVKRKEEIKKKRKELVDALVASWPKATSREVVDSQFYDEADYREASSLEGLFTFRTTMLGFVSEELLAEQVGEAALQAEQADMVNALAEVKMNGIALMRETISDLVSGLAESLTPGTDGVKKKFHASAVAKIMEYLESFQDRNLWGDNALQTEIDKLRGMVKGIDVNKLSAGDKGDDALREKVRKQMEKAKANLKPLLVDASARLIKK